LFFYVSNGSKRFLFESNIIILNDNKWHKIGISLNRSKSLSFVVDGRMEGIRGDNKLSDFNIVNRKMKLYIGSWMKSHFVNGALKNLSIYKRALSEQELIELTKIRK
jgi:hypothetical protein